MTWEQALAPSLEQTLNLILSALANFFGTTTQAIMANAPEWLAKYGWYVTLDLVIDAFIWLLNDNGAFITRLDAEEEIPMICNWTCNGFETVGYGCFY